MLADGSEDVVLPGTARVTTGGRLILTLSPPRPNPSSAGATIQFDVPSDAPHVTLAVCNVRGELVKRLVDGPVGRGRHMEVWDGTNESGQAVASGACFTRLEVAGDSQTEKIPLVR